MRISAESAVLVVLLTGCTATIGNEVDVHYPDEPATVPPTAPSDGADVWSPLSVMTVVNPIDHGAVGDGVADDLPALEAAIAALPLNGGLVYFPAGKTFRKNAVLTIDRPHIKLWAPNRQAEIFGVTENRTGRQALLCSNTSWCGFFGLKLRSDAARRLTTLRDHQISVYQSSDTEVVGVEIDGSISGGIFFYGSERDYVEGNYIHHTWADHIHHTAGSRASWCWDNYLFNEAPSKGDDGIACVTYGPTSQRCADMEWWNNVLLGNGNGRAYAVVGGNDIVIHDNWAVGSTGAGILVAAEKAQYNTASSTRIKAHDNVLYHCATNKSHSGILVSGTQPEPLEDLVFSRNVVVGTVNGQAYRAEGNYRNVVNTELSTDERDLPAVMPTRDHIVMRDTAILKTRDTSFVSPSQQRGLYRIHVRQRPDGEAGFEQRFEYIVAGPRGDMDAFLAEREAASDVVSERREVDGRSVALVLTAEPVSVPESLTGMTFRALRFGDVQGTLSWLWLRVNTGTY